MFDFHLHSSVSFDSKEDAGLMAQAALEKGLKEICFTDHIDHMEDNLFRSFTQDVYAASYDSLSIPNLKIHFGVEYGITPDNRELAQRELQERDYDFIIGSIHSIDNKNICAPSFWQGKATSDIYFRYLEEVLQSVQAHCNFDVLGHLTYICKVIANPDKKPILYREYPEIIDEILRILVKKGKGIEINTSAFERCGGFLPAPDVVRRFRELGGEIITIGSDAHNVDRVGKYCFEACTIAKDIFGYVCTFEKRIPIFHKL